MGILKISQSQFFFSFSLVVAQTSTSYGCNYMRGYCTTYCPYPQVDIGYYSGECPTYDTTGLPFICCNYRNNYNYNYNTANSG